MTNNINQVLFGAVWSILGEHAQAGSGSIWPFSVHGDLEGYGPFSVSCLPHGGRGAMQGLDGMPPIAFPHNSSVTPIEIMETQAPILILHKEFRADSAGAGRQRGGIGQRMTFRNIADSTIQGRIRPDKMFCAPPGLDGGVPGVVGEVRWNGRNIDRFPPLDLQPGDEIELLMPGGGGFGPVAERSADRSGATWKPGSYPRWPHVATMGGPVRRRAVPDRQVGIEARRGQSQPPAKEGWHSPDSRPCAWRPPKLRIPHPVCRCRDAPNANACRQACHAGIDAIPVVYRSARLPISFSTSLSWDASSCQPVARTLASSCSMLVTALITDDTPGWASSQARARSPTR